MQIAVELPDKIIKDLKHSDPFIEWLMKPASRIDKDKSTDISENHDDIIYS